MPCMQEFLQRAKADRPVYISDVRDAFCREGERPCTLLVHLYDNSARRFDLRLPRFATAEERAFRRIVPPRHALQLPFLAGCAQNRDLL